VIDGGKLYLREQDTLWVYDLAAPEKHRGANAGDDPSAGHR
jgi:hypothetical protein